MSAQNQWRLCNRCNVLACAGLPSVGACAAGGVHDLEGSGNYTMPSDAALGQGGQRDWRSCSKCHALAYAGLAHQGACPAGGVHDYEGSGRYTLSTDPRNDDGPSTQAGFGQCNKCQALAFSGRQTAGACSEGGHHDFGGSGAYRLIASLEPSDGPLTPAQLVALVAPRFAPAVHLHSKEQFLPSSVEWYLSQVKLYQGSTLVLPVGEVTPALVGAQTGPESDGMNLVVDDSSNNFKGEHTLTQAVLNIYSGQPLVNGGCTAPCYYHFVEVDSKIFLTFFFFYPCNGGLGPTAAWTVSPGIMNTEWGFYGHEGDWESITVVFAPGSDNAHIRMYAVSRQAHGDPVWTWSDPTQDMAISSINPITVYSSWHSHSSRPAAGSYPLDNPGTDYCDDGPLWTTAANLVNLDVAPPAWLPFTGRWGTTRELNWFPGLGPPLITSGPNGVESQGTWSAASIPYIYPGVLSTVQMICIHCGASDSHLWWASLTNGNWTGDQAFANNNRSSDGPAVTSYRGQVFCVHNGSSDEGMYFSLLDQNTGVWNTDTPFSNGNQGSAGPAVAVLNDTLYCVHKGGGNSSLWWCQFDAEAGNWTTDTPFSGGNQTGAGPALAVMDGTLYCVHNGGPGDNAMYWTSFNTATETWAVDQPFTDNRSGAGPALAVLNGTLYCVHSGEPGDDALYWCVFTPPSGGAPGAWSTDASVGNTSSAGPALAVLNGTLYCVHGGGNDSWMWYCTFDPTTNTWTGDSPFTGNNQIGGRPTLLMFGS